MNYKTDRIEEAILNALAEDIGTGDITTGAIIDDSVFCEADFLVKEGGIISGLEIAERVFVIVNEQKKNSGAKTEMQFTHLKKEGEKVCSGEIAAKVSGSASVILTAERTALNFLQRMSGIATMADKFQSEVAHTRARIIDTRKTVPGLRALDKMAVKAGGCGNHRIGLYDMYLIKDNHIAVAGSVTKAIQACKKHRRALDKELKIEVEVTGLEQLNEALVEGVDVIMLDNFKPAEMKKAVEITGGRCLLEASGGVNFDTVKQIAETGVDLISVGALTHSVKGLDISLEVSVKQ
jgi:nicotinate-nucleotide pyrophosphorylase (carboxylating)